jgi:hypothetical protein
MTRVPCGQWNVCYGWILGTRRRHAGAVGHKNIIMGFLL